MPEGNSPRDGRLETHRSCGSLYSQGPLETETPIVAAIGVFTLRLVDSNLPENLRCASAMMMKGIHSQTAAHGQKTTFSDARRQPVRPGRI